MTIVNAFIAEQLHSCGFKIVRKEDSPKKIRIDQVDVIQQNYFAMLENAKHLNAEFIDFDDQAWIVIKDENTHTLFGRILGSYITIRQSDGAIYIHGDGAERIVNSSFNKFVCCFNYFQSFVSGGRSRYIAIKDLHADDIVETIAIFRDIDEDNYA